MCRAFTWILDCPPIVGMLLQAEPWLGHFGASFAKERRKTSELVARFPHIVPGGTPGKDRWKAPLILTAFIQPDQFCINFTDFIPTGYDI